MVLKFSVFALTFLAMAVSAVKIPPQLQLKKCNYNDPNAEECLRVAIEDSIPKLKDGSPELGIPVLEPVEITEIGFETDKNAPVNLQLKLKNLKIYGVATGLSFQNLQWDKKKLIISINSKNDKVVMKGNYESGGRLLAIPIVGDGPIKIELTDVMTDTRMEFKEVDRKGVKYWDIVKMDYNVVRVGNTKMRLENLIKGNKALNDNLNQILNENWQELDRQMRPAFSKALKLYFFGISQRFFRRVPINELFDGFGNQS